MAKKRPSAFMETLREIWAFLWARKLFWLLPVILVILLLSLVMWVSGSATVLSPFLYAL